MATTTRWETAMRCTWNKKRKTTNTNERRSYQNLNRIRYTVTGWRPVTIAKPLLSKSLGTKQSLIQVIIFLVSRDFSFWVLPEYFRSRILETTPHEAKAISFPEGRVLAYFPTIRRYSDGCNTHLSPIKCVLLFLSNTLKAKYKSTSRWSRSFLDRVGWATPSR